MRETENEKIRKFAQDILNRPTYSPGRTDVGEFKQALEYLLELTGRKMAIEIKVSECEDCSCNHDGECNIRGVDVNCNRAMYGNARSNEEYQHMTLNEISKLERVKSGGIPEDCPLRSGAVVLTLAKDAWINKEKPK